MKSVIWQPEILWQNRRLALVWKPPLWLSVVPSQTQNPYPVLGLWAQKKLRQQVWPVHRLDQPVSGLWILAMDASTQKLLQNHWDQITKTYEAWITHEKEWNHGTLSLWEDRLQMGKKRAYPHKDGATCQIWVWWQGYVSIQKSGQGLYLKPEVQKHPEQTSDFFISRVKVRPQQGKRHQIRAQLALRRWPILGDRLYGSQWQWDLKPWNDSPVSFIALHLSEIIFPDFLVQTLDLPQSHFSLPAWDGFFRFPGLWVKDVSFNFDKWLKS